MKLKELATENPNNALYQDEFKKYLIVRKSDKSEDSYTINIREAVVEDKLRNAGWLVLVSNHIDNPKEALKIYRSKDVVEKGFHKLKNSLNMDRLRVHSDDRMQNKVFIGFIALILMSHIHKVMEQSNLYSKMTMDQMLLTLSKIKIARINGNKLIRPLTKEQKCILELFDIKNPVG
jgi:transposase